MPANAEGLARIAAACITRPQLAVLGAIDDAASRGDEVDITTIASAAGVLCVTATDALERLAVLRLVSRSAAGPCVTDAGKLVHEQLSPALAAA